MKYEEYAGNGARHRSAAQIESDVEEIRSEISQTLSELEAKFSPGELLDRMLERAKGAGGGTSDFLHNLGTTLRDHPVPVLLIGTGIAALLAADRGGGRRRPEERVSSLDGGRGRFEEAEERAAEKAGELKERIAEGKERAAEKAGELKERAAEKAGELKQRVVEGTREARARGGRMVKEHPLVLVGLGLALGAAMGAGIPVSETERRMIRPARREIQRHAADVVGRAGERAGEAVKAAGERAGEVMKTPGEAMNEPRRP